MFNFQRTKKRNSSPATVTVTSSDDDDARQRQQQGQQQPQIQDFYRDDALNPRRVDDLLTKEMMKLSTKDRNTISEEIHGVRCMALEETPQLLERSLRELDYELSKIPPAKKRAFIYCASTSTMNNQNNECNDSSSNNNNNNNSCNSNRQTSCCYVNTPEFRLRFLRCELFDAEKAAHRLVKFLDLVAFQLPFNNIEQQRRNSNRNSNSGIVDIDLDTVIDSSEFDPAGLRRPITLADFNDDEMAIIRKGHVQLLPFRDRSGRRVLAGVASLGIRFDPMSWYKIMLYFLYIAGDDVESQQKGIVIVLWPNPDIADSFQLKYPINRGGELARLVFQNVPVRVAAFHFCTPENVPFFQVVRSVFALVLAGGGGSTSGSGNNNNNNNNDKQRSRLKFHSGEAVELRYQIGGYGIPVDLLPLTPTGNVKLKYLKQWIRLRNTVEECVIREYNNKNNNNNFDNGNGNGNGNHQHHHHRHRHHHGNNNSNSNNTSIYCSSRGSSSSSSSNNNKNNSAQHGVSTMIECPGSLDVIFRPGKPVMNHPGNVTFRSLIESKSDQHDNATQTQKSILAKAVADEMIQVRRGRFLVWDDKFGCWTAILDRNKQRHKVAIAFRNFKTYRKAQRNRQTNDDESAMSIAFDRLDHGTGGTCSPLLGGNSGSSSSSSSGDDKKRKRATSCISQSCVLSGYF